MLVLGIETSCDDTAAAIVEDGRRVLSSVVSSQDSLHARYGGIVPELASRRHIEDIIPVVEEALRRAGAGLEDIGGIAATQGPGLVGSILVGLSFAKAVSYAKGVPLTGVNHIEAHAAAAFLREDGDSREALPFPFVALIVSGGHTTLLLVEGYTRCRALGQTIDDAAGEAFDKVAKLLGLGYPGGAAIDSLAKGGNPLHIGFTRPYMAKGGLNFSFSGIKTAVRNFAADFKEAIPEDALRDLAASFQEAVVDVLVNKAFRALRASGGSGLVVAGGVACNSRLRARLQEAAQKENARLHIPPPCFCSDNGAMVAALGFHRLREGMLAALDTNARPTWNF